MLVGILEQVTEQLEQIALIGTQACFGIEVEFATQTATGVHLVQPVDQASHDRCQLDRGCDAAGAGHRGALALVADDLVDALGLFNQQSAARRVAVVLGCAA